jgi:hypothetical protein
MKAACISSERKFRGFFPCVDSVLLTLTILFGETLPDLGLVSEAMHSPPDGRPEWRHHE